MAEEFAIDDEFDAAADNYIEENDNEAGDQVDLQGDEKDLGSGQ